MLRYEEVPEKDRDTLSEEDGTRECPDMERGRIILGKHTREDTNRQTKKIKATD